MTAPVSMLRTRQKFRSHGELSGSATPHTRAGAETSWEKTATEAAQILDRAATSVPAAMNNPSPSPTLLNTMH